MQPVEKILTDAQIEKLAREIAFRMAPDALLSVADVAAMLDLDNPRSVTEHMVKLPGFPKAIRWDTTTGGKSRPRFLRSDITTWINSHRGQVGKRGGRPRKEVTW